MCSSSLLNKRLQIKTQWGVAEARMLMDTREVQQVQLPEETEHDTTHSVMESSLQKSDHTDQNPRWPPFYCLSSSLRSNLFWCACVVCLHVCVRPRIYWNWLQAVLVPYKSRALHCWALSGCSVSLLAVPSSSCCKAPSKWTCFVVCQEPKRRMFQDFHILSSQVTSARAGVLPKAFHRAGVRMLSAITSCHIKSEQPWAVWVYQRRMSPSSMWEKAFMFISNFNI